MQHIRVRKEGNKNYIKLETENLGGWGYFLLYNFSCNFWYMNNYSIISVFFKDALLFQQFKTLWIDFSKWKGVFVTLGFTSYPANGKLRWGAEPQRCLAVALDVRWHWAS